MDAFSFFVCDLSLVCPGGHIRSRLIWFDLILDEENRWDANIVIDIDEIFMR